MLSLTFGILYNIGGTMPKVGKKNYPYTPAGKKAAAAAKKKLTGKAGY
jgi:hypothetical protein